MPKDKRGGCSRSIRGNLIVDKAGGCGDKNIG